MTTVDQEFLKEEVAKRANRVINNSGIQIPDEQAGRILEVIAASYFEQLIWAAKEIFKSNNCEHGSIDFAKLVEINISNRETETGEKDGNIIIYFTPGPQAKLLAKEDSLVEDYN